MRFYPLLPYLVILFAALLSLGAVYWTGRVAYRKKILAVLRFSSLFLLVVMSLWLFQVQDVWQVALLLVAGMLVVVPPLRRWSLVDGVIVLLAACDVASCLYGSCPVPALRQASFSVFFRCRDSFRRRDIRYILLRSSLL